MAATETGSKVEARRRSEAIPLPAYSVHMDVIRALAAFLVLAGHARSMLFGVHESQGAGAAAPATAVFRLGLGHNAVIVFFVLSGFLVGNSVCRAILSGRWSWRRYLSQRMTRLWIVLLPALFIGGCLDHTGMRFFSQNASIYTGPPGQTMVGQDLASLSTAKVLAGNAVFLQTILVRTYGTNTALWSLANEFWYYMAFPPLLLAFVGKLSIWMRSLYLILAVTILSFVGPVIATLFVVWLLGFGVSVLPLRLSPRHQRAVVTVALLQFLAVNVFVRMQGVAAPTAVGMIGVSFAMFLYAIIHERQPVGNTAYRRMATGFAKFSYTLYLAHMPFLTFLTALISSPWHAWPKDTPHMLAAVLVVSAVYVYSWVLYFCFERNTERVRVWIAS